MTRWFLLVAAGWSAATSAAARDGSDSAQSNANYRDSIGVELAVCGDRRLVRMHIIVVRAGKFFGGQPVIHRWNEVFVDLLGYFDTNDDSTLDRDEALHLPTAFELRQIMWRPQRLPSGRAGAVPLGGLDADGDGRATADELTAYYRRRGIGQPVVGVGRPPFTKALTEALVAHLDVDDDQRVTEHELHQAEKLLGLLDNNNDELVSAAELVPGATYPGAAGTTLLTPVPRVASPSGVLDGLPVITLPLDRADHGWTEEVMALRDSDGDHALAPNEVELDDEVYTALDQDGNARLTSTELANWRACKPEVQCRIEFTQTAAKWSAMLKLSGEKGQNAPLVERQRLLVLDSLNVEFYTAVGQLPRQLSEALTHLTNQFANGDTNQDGYLDAVEATAPNQFKLRSALHFADRNGDQRLSRRELDDWLAIQRRVGQSHVLVTLLDYGQGLFEAMDENHDGTLARRELRSTAARLKPAGLIDGGCLKASRLPRRFTITVSLGRPESALLPADHRGPAWFLAMDRNHDGDVSSAEFLGEPEMFTRIDTDSDGLISAAESQSGSVFIRGGQ